MRRILKLVLLFLLLFLAFALHVWSALAIYYCSFPSNEVLRNVAALCYLFAVVFLIAANHKRTRALFISFLGFIAVVFWFNTIQPGTDASYPQELSMPYAEVQGDSVIVHNVRNCDYRSRDDFDVRYETRAYNINELRTLDIFVNYWGMDAIAHTFLSFGFSDGQYLAVSIEIRPEVGESYGELKGLFKQYEIIYVWADERDIARLRSNYRLEDVYLYRIVLSPEQVRALFRSMVERSNELYEHPDFYNTCTQSCTNTIGGHIIKAKIFEIPFWKRRLLTGAIDRRMYAEGLLDTSRPFSELRKAALINERAKAADKDRNFSKKIRSHLKLIGGNNGTKGS